MPYLLRNAVQLSNTGRSFFGFLAADGVCSSDCLAGGGPAVTSVGSWLFVFFGRPCRERPGSRLLFLSRQEKL